MPERIKNGSFSQGFDDWNNPVGGGYAFTLDAGKAKAISSATVVTGLEHSMSQEFANYDYVLSARIWAWYQWSVPSGDVSNGSCKFKVRLVDSLGTGHTLADVTKTPGSGSGYLLENYNILSKFGNYGNFVLKLDCTPASAKDGNSSGVSNPYTTWTKYGMLTVLYDSDNKVKMSSYAGSGNTYTGTIEKTFVVDKATYDSRITIKVKGYKPPLPYAQADGKVILIKPDLTEVTLWSGTYGDDVWHTVLNNLDITAYVQATGTYKLKLWAQVRSGYDAESETWVVSEFHFDDVSLTVNWYTYSQATGWFDNFSIVLMCRYYKVVKEDIGAGESKTKKAIIGEKEDLGMGESYTTGVFKARAASEALGLQESFLKKVFKTVKEDIGLVESYFVPNFFKDEKEDIGLSESYLAQRRIPKSVSESIGLREMLWARLTRGNIVIDYDLTTKTEWTAIPKVTTPWIKRKTTVD